MNPQSSSMDPYVISFQDSVQLSVSNFESFCNIVYEFTLKFRNYHNV